MNELRISVSMEIAVIFGSDIVGFYITIASGFLVGGLAIWTDRSGVIGPPRGELDRGAEAIRIGDRAVERDLDVVGADDRCRRARRVEQVRGLLLDAQPRRTG